MVDLTPYNTLRLPAKAKQLIEIKTPANVKNLPSEDVLFLGQGANILFKSDFPGTVALVKLPGQKVIKETTDSVTVELGAGENWHEFVTWAVNQNLSGVENMVLIPGTVGAAAIGNIACYGQNQEDVFVKLQTINLKTQKKEMFSKADMHFAYRESIFRTHHLNHLITSVTYKLSKTAHLELSYHAARHASLLPTLQQIAKEPYTVKDVYSAVVKIRTEKLPDPQKIGTAGSFFKNPMVKKDVYLALKSQIPDLQSYPPEKLSYSDDLTDYVKIPAGMLLDKLGWKGKKIGHVGTYPTHALIVCNYGKATGSEVYEFSEAMRSDVLKNFKINLEYEVVIV